MGITRRFVLGTMAFSSAVGIMLGAGTSEAGAVDAKDGQEVHYVLRSSTQGIDYLEINDVAGNRLTWTDQDFAHRAEQWYYAKWTYRAKGAREARIVARTENTDALGWIECETWIAGKRVAHDIARGPHATARC
ncbi:hypothetical protein IA539_04205 [Gordonia sp. zg691]|uniref:Uncharacterized protein n=1 Tax=Gordonia jinghuaiqii TaxID=2758710 RepID=A0A7D7QP84_9ACTN|nr:hypothetical protein [Gordonia jinghuaiqii]MBD0860412.1 hypothetical protein [Gordonia jinghuaiqii]MCR5978318.1 hypothetical protein [Gordonia jinghuaiqii]QMT01246.1 hypothetical protein H1R19_20770 [Gordonia jinghuaiqii]